MKPVCLLHTKKGGTTVLPSVFNMLFPTSPFPPPTQPLPLFLHYRSYLPSSPSSKGRPVLYDYVWYKAAKGKTVAVTQFQVKKLAATCTFILTFVIVFNSHLCFHTLSSLDTLAPAQFSSFFDSSYNLFVETCTFNFHP